MSSWPPGYRSAPEDAAMGWMKVEIGHTVVITAIATQGYGEEMTPEWVSAYIVLYSQGNDYLYFTEINGQIQVSDNTAFIDDKLSQTLHCSVFKEDYPIYGTCSFSAILQPRMAVKSLEIINWITWKNSR